MQAQCQSLTPRLPPPLVLSWEQPSTLLPALSGATPARDVHPGILGVTGACAERLGATMGAQDASPLNCGAANVAAAAEPKGKAGCAPPHCPHTPTSCSAGMGSSGGVGSCGSASQPGAGSAASPACGAGVFFSDISPSHASAGRALLRHVNSISSLNKPCQARSNSGTDQSPDGNSQNRADLSSCHRPKSRAVSEFAEKAAQRRSGSIPSASGKPESHPAASPSPSP